MTTEKNTTITANKNKGNTTFVGRFFLFIKENSSGFDFLESLYAAFLMLVGSIVGSLFSIYYLKQMLPDFLTYFCM